MQFKNRFEGRNVGKRTASWLNQKITIFRLTLSRRFWGLIILGGFFLLFAGLMGAVSLRALSHTEPAFFAFLAPIGGFLSITLLYIAIRFFSNRPEVYIILSLLLAAAAFVIDATVPDLGVYARFSTRTIVLLTIVFGSLALFLLQRWLPAVVLQALVPFYAAGVFICVPFVISMAPFMPFAWLFVPFMGLGLLPYAPLAAAGAFIIAIIETDRRIRERSSYRGAMTARLASAAVAFILTLYLGRSALEWREIIGIFQENQTTASHRNDIHRHLPVWIRQGMRLKANQVTWLYLHTRSRKLDTNRFRRFGNEDLFFDPAIFLFDLFFTRPRLDSDARGKLLALLYNEKHNDLQRLWSGADLKTTSSRSRIQIFPAARLAYVETNLNVYNNTNGTKEAIYTIGLPPGGAATALSLWIDGREEEGRFTLKSTARRAYRTIVGIERRDPSLLRQLDDSNLRLRVFPVDGQKSRTVKFGLVIPLKYDRGRLYYNPPVIDGPSTDGADQEIEIDLFTAGGKEDLRSDNIGFTEEPVSDNEVPSYRYRGAYRADYQVSLTAPQITGAAGLADGEYFSVENIVFSKKPFIPRNIYLLLNRTRSKDEWMEMYERIRSTASAKTNIVLVGRTWFSSRSREKVGRFLDQCEIPSFNVMPFHMLPKEGPHLLVVAGSDRELNYARLSGSDFFERMERFFTAGNEPVAVAALNGAPDPYLEDLRRRGRVELVARSTDELMGILGGKSVTLPVNNENAVSIERSGVTIRRIDRTKAEKSSVGDLAGRLFYRQRLFRLQRNLNLGSLEKEDRLRQVAARANLVSGLSSLIVLETERDYLRFGIKKHSPGMGGSQIQEVTKENSDLGMVPEPEEYALLAVLLAVFGYLQRKRLAEMFRAVRGMQWTV